MTVRGQAAGSVNEENTAAALDKLGLDYAYQYSWGGGRVLGGQVIDFIVYTKPKPTPVYVQGAYWHGGKNAMESKLKMWQVEAATRAYWFAPVELTEEETSTVDKAYEAIKRKVL